ncbi:TetR/AcrR family transcriptional regulator [Flavobacteriaceae bacterium]|jgi:AcrR family transcriptional regulator|nr:TetR/AcrR family transcriptional regulator [Flavobacteriaceae bacterium]MDA9972084.1 TetR/AcrR family transcriptional regulator [Flavobacteriaceae bacterium]MDB4186603.1 TetR/AcrR family transcriptional regulator [Flavobacteriaceae bacterium]
MPSSEPSKRKRGRPSLSQTLDLNDILIAALDVFAEKGYDGAQLKDVAQKVGVTNPLISYRFENKEDLWKKAVSFLGEKLVDRFEHIKSYYVDLTGTMALRAYTRQYIYFLAENPALYKIIFQELGHDTWRSTYLIEQLFTPVIWFGEKSIETPLDSLKEFKTIPRANFISIIMGASSSFFMLSQLMRNQYGTEVFSKEQIEQHAEIVNNIIFSQFEP